ncbi:MAG: class I SAM-dependent methyltransferase [Ignavibacteriales bacterium]|nr:MAG: class I SAM-dependent methyltransferase [Ignavibacteriales bacterium]
MSTLNDDVAESLGGNREILPYLPELLADLNELGGSSELIVGLIESHHLQINSETTCLDLGCGKGLIAINIARHFGINVLGIDGMLPFIHQARKDASENGVSHLCTFEQADIKYKSAGLKDFDIVILSAVGHLWGDFYKTLTALKNCTKEKGIIIIDDAYTIDGNGDEHLYPSRKNVLKDISDCGLEIITEKIIGDDEIKQTNENNTRLIISRAEQLKKKYPEKSNLFDEYIKRQQTETELFGTRIKCVVWVLKKSN